MPWSYKDVHDIRENKYLNVIQGLTIFTLLRTCVSLVKCYWSELLTLSAEVVWEEVSSTCQLFYDFGFCSGGYNENGNLK